MILKHWSEQICQGLIHCRSLNKWKNICKVPRLVGTLILKNILKSWTVVAITFQAKLKYPMSLIIRTKGYSGSSVLECSIERSVAKPLDSIPNRCCCGAYVPALNIAIQTRLDGRDISTSR